MHSIKFYLMFYLKKQIRGDVMEKIYIIDDTLEIPEEIRNMSEEEMDQQIAILEEAGRREKEKIEAREKENFTGNLKLKNR